jgi:hypothetical protein
MSLEISASKLIWEECTPLLGARVLWFEHPLVLSLIGGGGLSLEEYSKGFGWVFFPC